MTTPARTRDRFIVSPIIGGWRIGGEIDASTAAALAEALATHRPDIAGRHLVADLSAVSFIDSSGLDAFLGARDQLAANGCVLVLRRPSHRVVRLLDITQLRRAFRIEEQRSFLRRHEHRRLANAGRRRLSRR